MLSQLKPWTRNARDRRYKEENYPLKDVFKCNPESPGSLQRTDWNELDYKRFFMVNVLEYLIAHEVLKQFSTGKNQKNEKWLHEFIKPSRPYECTLFLEPVKMIYYRNFSSCLFWKQHCEIVCVSGLRTLTPLQLVCNK